MHIFTANLSIMCCGLLLALSAPAMAANAICYSSHDCPKSELPDRTEAATGSEAGKGKVDVGRHGIVTFDVSDMKKNTQMTIGACEVDYKVTCKPLGKSKEAPAAPDVVKGFNVGADKCAQESKKPIKVKATITYTNKDGTKVEKSGENKAEKDEPPVSGGACAGYVPVGTCVTP